MDDTLVSVRAPIGDNNVAWEECCIGRDVAAFRHKSGASSFTYYSSQSMKPEIKVYEQGRDSVWGNNEEPIRIRSSAGSQPNRA